MGEGGDAHTSPTAPPSETIPSLVQAQQRPVEINVNGPVIEDIASVASPGLVTPNPFTRKNTSLDLDDYFSGPRDLQKHSKWPIFLQMHGSILPKMILPLLAVAAWSTLFTVLHMKVAKMGIQSILLTVLGFVVGLGLSFRNSTAYERYIEGRKYWAQLALACNNLGRMYWVHAVEREEFAEEDVLAKLTALNLLVAFATALKHKLRFEPYTNYDDIASLVDHLDTFAKSATKEDAVNVQRLLRKRGFFKSVGESLGVSFAESNPRKALKRATRPVGNLPLEILSYLGAFTDDLVKNGQLPVPMHQTITYNNMATLNDVMTGTERVLNTPLPIAYSISISQITWVYILVLPFQLLGALEWVTIPATVFAAYIILGLLFIGFEIENPFGRDVNDLNLEAFCAQIATEMDIIASRPRPKAGDWIKSANNHVLWPLSNSGYQVWSHRGTAKIREAIIHKVESNFAHKKAAAELAEAGKTQSHTKSPVVEKLNGENV